MIITENKCVLRHRIRCSKLKFRVILWRYPLGLYLNEILGAPFPVNHSVYIPIKYNIKRN